MKQIEIQLVVVNRSGLTSDRRRVFMYRLKLPIFLVHILSRDLISDLGKKTVSNVFERLDIKADLAY